MTGVYMNTNIKKVEEHKMVAVADLPDGYFKEKLSEYVKDANRAMVCVVAKEGNIGDWACYIGWPKYHELKDQFQTENNLYYCTKQHYVKGVKSYGDKVSQKEAEQLFPEWSNRIYRR